MKQRLLLVAVRVTEAWELILLISPTGYCPMTLSTKGFKKDIYVYANSFLLLPTYSKENSRFLWPQVEPLSLVEKSVTVTDPQG